MLESKDFYIKEKFMKLEVGDVFKFTTVGKFFTVNSISDGEIKYNTTFGRISRYRQNSLTIDGNEDTVVYIFPDRRREIRPLKKLRTRK